jgi:hypothetical protein
MRVGPVYISFLKETRDALSYRHCSFHILNRPQLGCGLKYFMRLAAIGIAYAGRKRALRKRFGEQLGHMLWMEIREVGDLMATACA